MCSNSCARSSTTAIGSPPGTSTIAVRSCPSSRVIAVRACVRPPRAKCPIETVTSRPGSRASRTTCRRKVGARRHMSATSACQSRRETQAAGQRFAPGRRRHPRARYAGRRRHAGQGQSGEQDVQHGDSHPQPDVPSCAELRPIHERPDPATARNRHAAANRVVPAVVRLMPAAGCSLGRRSRWIRWYEVTIESRASFEANYATESPPVNHVVTTSRMRGVDTRAARCRVAPSRAMLGLRSRRSGARGEPA